jgi:hypothetical protein
VVVFQGSDKDGHCSLHWVSEQLGFWPIQKLTEGHDAGFTPPPFGVQNVVFDKSKNIGDYGIAGGLGYQA